MFGRLFPVFCLLSTCTVLGHCYVSNSSQPASALVGEDAVLPCLLDPAVSEKVKAVEWSKPGLDPYVVYLYRDGCETHGMKDPAYEHRTKLFMKELKRGNFSLLLSKVQLSDAGKYSCKIDPRRNSPRVNLSVELQVGAVSQPVIVMKADSSGVFLECEAKCWFPEPEIQWLDGDGSNITTEPTRRKGHDSGCFTVTSRLTVTETATNRFTCRVHQQEINQTRKAEIQIPDCMKSCTKQIAITVVLTIFLTLVILGVYFGWRKCRHGKDAKNTPPLLPVIENKDNIIKELRSHVAELEKQLRDKNKQIKKLQSEEQLCVCQHDQPTIPCVLTDPTGTTDSKSLLGGSTPCNLPRDHSPKAGNLTTHDNDPKPSTSRHRDHPNSPNSPKAKAPKPGTSTQNKNPTASLPADSNNLHHSTADLSEGSKPNHKRTRSVSHLERPSMRPFRVSSFSSFSVLSYNRFSPLAESDPESENLLSEQKCDGHHPNRRLQSPRKR